MIRFNKYYAMFFIGILSISCTACVKPFHEPLLVDINTSEVAFLVETVNSNGQAVVAPKDKSDDDQSYFIDRYVNARKVEIPYYFKRDSRVYWWDDSTTGRNVPAARLITVETAPVNRKWSPDNNGIWVESRDSVQFSTGISMTANIANKEDAIKFLANYPPQESRVVESKGGDPFTVETTSLSQIMDHEVHAKIQEAFSYEAAGYPMDELRSMKREIMDAVHKKVIPYFKSRGITIMTLGQFGGFEYGNDKTREAIDAVFQAQQDKEKAIAEADAAEQRKVALRLQGEGDAARILEQRKGEAEGIKTVADAKAYEVAKLQENPEAYLALQRLEIERERSKKWSGILPVTVLGDNGGMGGMFMNLDAVPKK